MALFRKLFYRKPPDGLLEISERVYVFDCCFTTDVWEEENYKGYVGGVISQLRDHYPDVSILVFNFREGELASRIANALSEYDTTIMDYPRHYEGCPLLPMEVIHHFLRSSESWLSLGQQNVLLMHCERGGWPVLAFMLAALLIYRKQYSGEQKTLDMVYKQAPRELLHFLSPLNPLPSQLRYLQYVSRRNLVSEWPPLDRALTLDCIIIRMIPNFDGEGGCRPIFRIYGQDPFLVADRTPKVLFSTPKKSKAVRHYKQVECELVKIDINCHIQGDVVLECISLHDDMQREVMMFRVMFNTAFIRSNILMLNREDIDILWGAKDRFPKDFRAEVLFSEMDAAASVVPVDLSCFEEKDGLPMEAFAKVHEIFSSVDWLVPKADAALSIIQQASASNFVPEKLATESLHVLETRSSPKEPTGEKRKEKHSSAPLEKNDKISICLTPKEKPCSSPRISSDAKSEQKTEAAYVETKSVSTTTQLPPRFAPSEPSSIVSAEVSNVTFPSSSSFPPYHLSDDRPIYPSTQNEDGMRPKESGEAKAIPFVAATESLPLKSISSTPPIPSPHPPKEQSVGSRQTPSPPPMPPPPVTPPLLDKLASRGRAPPPPPPPGLASPEIMSSSDAMATSSGPISDPSPSLMHPIPDTPAKNDNTKRIIPPPPPPPPRLLSPEIMSSTNVIGTVAPISASSHPLTHSIPATPEKNDNVKTIGASPPAAPQSTSLTENAAGKIGSLPPPATPTLIPSSPSLKEDSVNKIKFPPSPPPTLPLKENSNSVSRAGPPPPPPAPPTPPLKESSAIEGGSVPSPPPPISPLKENLTLKSGSVPPPPPSTPSLKENSASRAGPPPIPPVMENSASRGGAPLPPPPIPPPKENLVSGGGPSPSPPPPLPSGPAAVPNSSSLVPPPPPPPMMASTAKHTVPSAPPPPPPSTDNLKSGTGPTHSVPVVSGSGSNSPVSPSPPPPSFPPPGMKGKSLLSRTMTSKNNQTKKLKPLHWLKLTRAVQGSLWAETQKSGEASKAPEIDISELESLFSAAVPNSDQGGSGRKANSRGSLGQKSEKVQLVDHRRAYNCEIMLSKVKIPLPDLLSSVLALEDSAIDVDQVENLIKFCPTKEEMELLKGYKGERDKLGKCEQFFLELMQVPRIEPKLRVFSFKLQFQTQVSELGNNLNIVNSASDQIRNSCKLKRIMQTILSLGNALNQGTARGSAVGFRLDSLLKLTETRARNNKMTLMHYLCKVLADKLPELLDFSRDLSSLEPAAKIQLKFLAEEMQAVSKGLEKIVQELSMSENDGPVSENFRKALKEFLCFAEAEVRSLASLYSAVGRNVDALILYFGEDPSRCPFEQVISTLLNFVRMFNRSHEENCKQAEFERKKAEKEAAAAKKLKTNAPEKILSM